VYEKLVYLELHIKLDCRTMLSWGGYPKVSQSIVSISSRLSKLPKALSLLPYGLGRSYGDSCLNEGGTLILTDRLNHLIEFDRDKGLLTTESGVSFADLLNVVVPAGWFIPVSPGTKFVTVGGAIANDIHGKNHHVAGTFGRHVTSLELLRSDGTRTDLTPNDDLFRATVGGLGLTGLITKATFSLTKIPSPFVLVHSLPFKGLDRFFEISENSNSDYTVAWVDCLSKTPRGIFMEGDFTESSQREYKPQKEIITFPFYAPGFLLNSLSIQLFNEIYFQRVPTKGTKKTVSLNPFFYPLDSIHNWNKMYGKAGFLQWQCVVPKEGIGEIFSILRKNRAGSFLAVLKTFGDAQSPGLLSFPRAGVTLALDFPIRGLETFKVLDLLDSVVREHRGALYPAKDARMSKEMFTLSFPKLTEFKKFIDPHFSSSFWRRV